MNAPPHLSSLARTLAADAGRNTAQPGATRRNRAQHGATGRNTAQQHHRAGAKQTH
jgi:hypothetical protein